MQNYLEIGVRSKDADAMSELFPVLAGSIEEVLSLPEFEDYDPYGDSDGLYTYYAVCKGLALLAKDQPELDDTDAVEPEGFAMENVVGQVIQLLDNACPPYCDYRRESDDAEEEIEYATIGVFVDWDQFYSDVEKGTIVELDDLSEMDDAELTALYREDGAKFFSYEDEDGDISLYDARQYNLLWIVSLEED